jgi:hypothetical protein
MSVENPYCVRYAADGRMVAGQGAMVPTAATCRIDAADP